jgi:hypothetical protein
MISHREQHSMHALYTETARDWVRMLEDTEAERASIPVARARLAVARRTGVHAGALGNIRHGRIKAIAVHVFAALRSAVERELLSEMARLEHELQILRQTGAHATDDQIGEVETHLSAARRALGR